MEELTPKKLSFEINQPETAPGHPALNSDVSLCLLLIEKGIVEQSFGSEIDDRKKYLKTFLNANHFWLLRRFGFRCISTNNSDIISVNNLRLFPVLSLF